MSPQTRELYEYAEKHAPGVYDALRDIDTSLAEHAMAGVVLLRTREMMLRNLLTHQRYNKLVDKDGLTSVQISEQKLVLDF